MFKAFWRAKALNTLSALPKTISLQIKDKVEKYLAQSPYELGKSLSYPYKSLYSYRMGNYRIIYSIDQAQRFIIIEKIGHRSNVYD